MKKISLKRILSTVLALAMLLSTVQAMAKTDNNQATQTTDKTYAEKVICGLGLIDDDDEINWEEGMTRAEFTEIIYRILNYDQYDTTTAKWSQNFFGDKNANTGLIEEIADGRLYSDVSEEEEHYAAISFLSGYGLIGGFDDGTFRPNEIIESSHALKIVINLMGFETFIKSYPSADEGYREIANIFKLASTGAKHMRRDDVAQLVYNALTAEYKIDYTNLPDIELKTDGPTMLEKYLKLEYTRGVMNDNGYTSLVASQTKAGEGNIALGDKILHITENTSSVVQYLARDVEAFYTSDDTDSPDEVAFAVLSGRDSVTTIMGKNVKKYSNGRLSYYNENKTIDKSFADGASVLYNYELLPKYDSDTFMSPTSYITLITPYGTNKAEYVMVEDYESIFVGSMKDSSIYNTIRYAGESNIMDLEKDAERTIIYKADGKEGTIDDIKVNTVIDVAKSKNLMIIKICDKTDPEFVIKAMGKNNDGQTYSNGETSYNIYEKMNDSATNKPDVRMNQAYTIYLNSFDQIVWIATAGQSDDIKFGFMLRLYNDDSDIESGIVILNDLNEWKTILLSDKIKYSDENGIESTYKEENFKTLMASYRGVIRYKTDKEGLLTYVEIPITNKSCTVDGKLRLLGDTSTEDGKGTYWRTGSNNIGSDIIVSNSSAKFVAVNPELDAASKEAYSIKTSPLVDYTAYSLLAYTTKLYSRVAEYVFMESSASTAALSINNRGVAIVKSIGTVYDEDEGDAVTAINIYDMPEEKTSKEAQIVVKDESVMEAISMFDDVGLTENPQTYTIDKGDIIRYSLDSYGKVEKIELLWDYSKPNSLDPNGRTGGFVGALDWYDASTTYGNPFAYIGSNKMCTNPKQIANLNFRAFSGYVYKVIDSAVTVTTQDLSLYDYDVENSDSRFVTEAYFLLGSGYMANVTVGRGEVNVSTLKEEQIKPFDLYGSDCSRIVFIGSNGGPKKMIVYNEE